MRTQSIAQRCMTSLFCVAIWPAQAHDIYTHLTDRHGRSCCDGTDCRAVPYRKTSSGFEMRVNDKWVLIPREKIERRTIEGDTGETAGGHWCGERYEGGVITYCAFVPPDIASR